MFDVGFEKKVDWNSLGFEFGDFIFVENKKMKEKMKKVGREEGEKKWLGTRSEIFLHDASRSLWKIGFAISVRPSEKEEKKGSRIAGMSHR